jgi:hypothetical protein
MIKNSRAVVYQHMAAACDLRSWTNQFAMRHGLRPVEDITLFVDLVKQSVEYFLYANSRWAKNAGTVLEQHQDRLDVRLGFTDVTVRRDYYQKIFDRVVSIMEEVLSEAIQPEPYDIWDIRIYERMGIMKITYDGDYRIRVYDDIRGTLNKLGNRHG